jgi:small subunit ribosomal protein S1
MIFAKVKGGFTVDLDGAVAFLPGSQVDVRPVRDITPLMNQKQPFQILKMDRRRGNIVVSRRSVLEETRAEQRADIVARTCRRPADRRRRQEHHRLRCVHRSRRHRRPVARHGHGMAPRQPSVRDPVNVGDTVKVQIIRINQETQRISLGMKQLQADPWLGIEAKYPVDGKRFTGTVTNIADYGAFVELEPGVEGLIHVSEMSWVKKNVHPGKIVSTSQQVDVQVLEVDPNKRRISLGLKQTQDNPWDAFLAEHPKGSNVKAKSATSPNSACSSVSKAIDGMVHLSDLDWNKAGRRGDQGLQQGRR